MNWSSADSAMPAKATTSDMPDFVVPPSCGGSGVSGWDGSGEDAAPSLGRFVVSRARAEAATISPVAINCRPAGLRA